MKNIFIILLYGCRSSPLKENNSCAKVWLCGHKAWAQTRFCQPNSCSHLNCLACCCKIYQTVFSFHCTYAGNVAHLSSFLGVDTSCLSFLYKQKEECHTTYVNTPWFGEFLNCVCLTWFPFNHPSCWSITWDKVRVIMSFSCTFD